MFDFLPADRERVSPRHAAHIPCEVVRDRDFKTVGLELFDLSLTGMMIESLREDVSVGDEVVITFRPPQTARYVDACGIIVRVIGGRRRGDNGPAIGILFTELDRASFITLRTALRRLPQAKPKRQSRMDYAAIVRMISVI